MPRKKLLRFEDREIFVISYILGNVQRSEKEPLLSNTENNKGYTAMTNPILFDSELKRVDDIVKKIKDYYGWE